MYLAQHLGPIALCIGFVGTPLTHGQPPKDDLPAKPSEDRRDLTLLKRISERTFVHEPTNVAYTIPEGWKEIRPHRLARNIDKHISTVLGIEHGPRELVASLYWIQMTPTQKLSDWVRDTPTPTMGEYGEEFETLKAVYGKDHVTVPTKFKHGPFQVYQINIQGGPERAEKYDGTLFVFEADREGEKWLVKARISFPKGDRAINDQFARDVLQGYSIMPPDKPASEPKKNTGLDGSPQAKSEK